MLDPKLAEDKRLLSFHTTEEQDFNEFLTRYFENINIKVYEKKRRWCILLILSPPQPKKSDEK